jgi:hypothetical protein
MFPLYSHWISGNHVHKCMYISVGYNAHTFLVPGNQIMHRYMQIEGESTAPRDSGICKCKVVSAFFI